MIKCSYCGAMNPDDAKFCSVCGKSPQVMSVKWKDMDLVKTKSFGWYSGTVLLSVVGFFCLFGSFTLIVFESDIIAGLGYFIPSIIFSTISYRLISGKNKKTKELRSIASDIEDTVSNIRFLTKTGKYGLYNWKKMNVLLQVVYDSIEKQDDFFYTVKKSGKYGIYSRHANALIVDCEYDAVTPFVNNVATITKGNVTKKVDTQVNKY